VTMLLCWVGGVRLVRALGGPAATFHRAKNVAVAGLTLSLLMWLAAFLSVGGEWFLMWQSKAWNGQEAAFRMFAVVGIVLVFLALPDSETQP
jgi:predicted small integral membrane protein